MKGKIQEVQRANDKFYEAVKHADFDLIKNVWAKDSNVKCVHPGWPMLHGWEAVSQSWQNIFSNGSPIDIELRDVDIQISGNSAWVICIEKISYKIDEVVESGFAQSTNIFKFDGNDWLLVLHHASPIPAPRGEESPNQVLQ